MCKNYTSFELNGLGSFLLFTFLAHHSSVKARDVNEDRFENRHTSSNLYNRCFRVVFTSVFPVNSH